MGLEHPYVPTGHLRMSWDAHTNVIRIFQNWASLRSDAHVVTRWYSWFGVLHSQSNNFGMLSDGKVSDALAVTLSEALRPPRRQETFVVTRHYIPKSVRSRFSASRFPWCLETCSEMLGTKSPTMWNVCGRLNFFKRTDFRCSDASLRKQSRRSHFSASGFSQDSNFQPKLWGINSPAMWYVCAALYFFNLPPIVRSDASLHRNTDRSRFSVAVKPFYSKF